MKKNITSLFSFGLTTIGLSTLSISCRTTRNSGEGNLSHADQTSASIQLDEAKRQKNLESIASMEEKNKYEGHATIFSTFGSGGGGCGPSEEVIMKETDGRKAWVALNVFNTPGYHENLPSFKPNAIPRPIPVDMKGLMGLYQNGQNCGRWIRASFPFEGKTVSTSFVVTDSCGDGNLWCRDDPGHVDLSVYEIARMVVPQNASCYSLEEARKNIGWKCFNLNWENMRVNWEYIDPPHDDKSILFHWHNRAKLDWHSVIVSRLKNGISGLQVKGDKGWYDLKNESDAGQRFQLPAQQNNYEVKVLDRLGKPYPGSYTFSFPADKCKAECGQFVPAQATYHP